MAESKTQKPVVSARTLHDVLNEIDADRGIPDDVRANGDAWLAAAWDAATDPHVLGALLLLLKHPQARAMQANWPREDGAARIRAAVAPPPKFAEVDAAVAAQGEARRKRMAEAQATWPARKAELYARREAQLSAARLAAAQRAMEQGS